MKILYFSGNVTPGTDLSLLNLLKTNHRIYIHNIQETRSEEFNFRTRHFQMYQRLLDRSEELNIDLIYFCVPIVPEYLLFELKTRPFFKPKIVFPLMLRGLDRSISRCLALKELVDRPEIFKIPTTVMITENLKFPENMYKVDFDFSKLALIHETFSARTEDIESFNSTKEIAREYLHLKNKDFIVSISGSWAFTKGVDIFIEALKYINEDIAALIHKHNYGVDAELPKDLLKSAKKNHRKTIILEQWLSPKVYPYLYLASDVIVCSHKKSYAYSESGIPGMAAKANKLLVAPDFYYFNELIDRFKIGVKYIPEDPLDMARAINYAKENYKSLTENARFDEMVKDYKKEEDVPTEMVKIYENSIL